MTRAFLRPRTYPREIYARQRSIWWRRRSSWWKMAGFALIIIVLLLLVRHARAQQSFNLTVPETQLNTIGKALGKLPYEEVAATIQAMAQQVADQQRAIAEKAKASEKVKE